MRTISVITYIGENTIYIYLYHYLIRDIEIRVFNSLGLNLEKVINKTIFFVIMIIMPVVVKNIVLKVAKIVRKEISWVGI